MSQKKIVNITDSITVDELAGALKRLLVNFLKMVL